MIYRVDTRGLGKAQNGRREVQLQMTRQPTGPDAGAVDGDPRPSRRNNGQLTRCGGTVHAPPQRRTGPRSGDALPARRNKAAVHPHLIPGRRCGIRVPLPPSACPTGSRGGRAVLLSCSSQRHPSIGEPGRLFHNAPSVFDGQMPVDRSRCARNIGLFK